jgi:hypothetical protein
MTPEDRIRELRDNTRWRTRLTARQGVVIRPPLWGAWVMPAVAAIAIVVLFLGGISLVRANTTEQEVAVAPPTTSSTPAPAPSSPTPTSNTPSPGPSWTPTPTGNDAQVPDRWRVEPTESNPLGLPSTHDYPTEDLRNASVPANNFGYVFGYDYGPASGASGTTALDPDGHPVSYTAAAGDIWDTVAERFGIQDLYQFNCVRRSSLYLYTGDVINLSPYTVTTVGSENGTDRSNQDCLSNSGLPEQFD